MAKAAPAAQRSVSTDISFQPRKEFHQSPIVPHAFGLVSFNGSEILRLANFENSVVHAVRRVFAADDIRHFREDLELVVCEFVLAGKPFNGRSTRQEQILLAIFGAILSQNYTLITNIDYGRIQLDKLTLAFKRALIETQRIPRFETFGISFASTTVLRVISPPLALTPAILQVVRSAWPHGVISEKRDPDGSYSFKLKGYSFFKQSTFETDSLTHILELLRGMNSHGFNLVCSICLNKRSRVQDFWIFSALAPPSVSTTAGGSSPIVPAAPFSLESPTQSHSMLGSDDTATTRVRPPVPLPSAKPSASFDSKQSTAHVRSASNPPKFPEPRGSSHARNASLPGNMQTLRKPSPASKTPTPPRTAENASEGFQQSPHNPPRNISPSHNQRSVISEYPQYPPNSRPIQRYPVDHDPTAPQLLYTASPSKEPLYNTVPSTAFNLLPISPSKYVTPAGVPATIPETPSPPIEEHNQPLLGSGVFRDTTVSSLLDDSDSTPTHSTVGALGLGVGALGQFTLSESGLRKAESTVVQEHPNAQGGVLGRSPKVIHPDLPSDDPARRISDQPLHGFAAPPPPPPLDEPTTSHVKHTVRDGNVVSDPPRTTTKAAAAEVVLYSAKNRKSVEVPMTVRDSDAAWVLIHPPGTVPRQGESPVPPAGGTASTKEKFSSPLRVIAPTRPPAVPTLIPTDGNQASYGKRRKSNFPWSKSRREKRAREASGSDAIESDDNVTLKKDEGKGKDAGASSPEDSSLTPSSSPQVAHSPLVDSPHLSTPTGESPGGFAKGVVGKFRRNKQPVEVGSADRRLTID